ncbi:hypothetical protein PRIPAC_75686 [Pristionchus pacificus]|uniref:Uncharacterized protein n=1 Tax=Pristionchus pacificus TaxID=54126 RepID=A0A2A6BFH6_PRIPA|nr:hypothetical protein PRIPAC_75686 [Pristionchus pacificus]|eukprot:PDM64644.1 hypothetical protein PRIPAC_52900 [Pristionchus pacificus]
MFISKMKSIELLFALASLASVAFTSITKETVEPYEEEPVFHPRGVQQFKGNSNLPFRLLSVTPTDRITEGDDTWFRFGKLESTHVAEIENLEGDEIHYLNLTGKPPVMRLYFNPGANRVGSLRLKVLLGYMIGEGEKTEHKTQYLTFPNDDDHLLCPKTERYEFGSCHYHRNQSTFEQITLPIDQWPKEAKVKGTHLQSALTDAADEHMCAD